MMADEANDVVRWGDYTCHVCGGTNLFHLDDKPRNDTHMVMDDGRRCTSVIRTKVQCECGAYTGLVQYEYDPSVWVE